MEKTKKALLGLWQFGCYRVGKQLGKQRFRCSNCGILIARNDPLPKSENRFIWFRKWILERQTFKTLSRESS